MLNTYRHIRHLDSAECWALLDTETLGRLAVLDETGRPDLFPINYLVHYRRLYMQSVYGSKTASILRNPAVAFEVDSIDAAGDARWSVVIRGNATLLEDEELEIRGSGVRRLASFEPSKKWDYIRVAPASITGIMIEPGADNGSTVRGLGPLQSLAHKPKDIPHRPPIHLSNQ